MLRVKITKIRQERSSPTHSICCNILLTLDSYVPMNGSFSGHLSLFIYLTSLNNIHQIDKCASRTIQKEMN